MICILDYRCYVLHHNIYMCNDSDPGHCSSFHPHKSLHQIPVCISGRDFVLYMTFPLSLSGFAAFPFFITDYFCGVLFQICTKSFRRVLASVNIMFLFLLINEQCVSNEKPHAKCFFIFDANKFVESLSQSCIFLSKDNNVSLQIANGSFLDLRSDER